MMKYLSFVLIFLMIFIITQESDAQTTTPSNIKADSMLSEIQVSYPFSFVVLGDSQPYDGQLLNETFFEILFQIADLTTPPTFAIICGDLTESGSEEGYIAYSECINDWMVTTGIPFYSVPGNHDFYGTNAFEYYSTYIDPKRDYCFDYGNSRFLGINNVQHPGELYYHINETQLDSVDVWLSSAPENIFAFNHASIIRDDHGGGFLNPGYEEFHNMLNSYDAIADFNGHHRDYYRHDLDDIYYITTSGAGGDLGGIYYPPLSYDQHHWLLVTVDEFNNTSIEMYFYEGGHNNIASLYDFQLRPVQIPPAIYINEFMASNNTTIADPQGDYDDWIEIYNADTYPVDIGGMYITDDFSDPAKWKIPDTQPDSTTIQPGEFLLLWADEDTDDGVLHLNIKLRATGEEIGIYTDDLTSIIDTITFGEQILDVSFGRDIDGMDNWVFMDNPTPGYSNNIEVDFSADPLTGSVPLEVQFTDTSIGNITSWEWDFNNDGNIDSIDENPLFTFLDTGIYTVSLTVFDGMTSITETKVDYIEVIEALDADFLANPVSGISPLVVEFTSNSTGDITNWEWDFDDDGMIDSTEENPSHTYSDSEDYSVSLTVSDGVIIDTELKIDYISVGDQIVADFTADPLTGTVPLTVNFTSTSSGTITIWEWDFDNDGNIDSIDENPTYIYTEIGVYTVSLTVSDGLNSDSEVIIDYIEITETGIEDDLPSYLTELYKNHPNPFNPTTNIQFDIKDNETGVLTIFNIKGQILVSQSFNPGKHDYVWNANYCSSGVYFYKLQTENFTETKKMLLLK